MDLEAEILSLKRRVGDLEGAMGLLLGQVGRLPADILALQTDGARRFVSIEAQFRLVIDRLDSVNAQVWSLRDDLPEMIVASLKSVTSGE
jgi:hypothetical protein